MNSRIQIGSDSYPVRPLSCANWLAPDHWLALDSDGRWSASEDGLVGEWVCNSPSLFLSRKIDHAFVWQLRVTRVRPSRADFDRRFAESPHTAGAKPESFYNVNFWLRADVPGESQTEDFLDHYPRRLGTGWNGMGDDYWRSLYCTVVCQPGKNWCRLRRGPGYELVCDTADRVPPMDYDAPHEFTFVVCRHVVRAYCDGRQVFEHRTNEPVYPTGYIGLCIWMCAMRFDDMRLYELIAEEDGDESR